MEKGGSYFWLGGRGVFGRGGSGAGRALGVCHGCVCMAGEDGCEGFGCLAACMLGLLQFVPGCGPAGLAPMAPL